MRVAAMLALLLLLGLSPAAAGAPATPAAGSAAPAICGPVPPEVNRETALAWYAAIGEDDLARWDALMTPDTVYNGAAIADGDNVGFVKNAYQGAIASFSSLAYAPLAIAARDDLVAVRFRASGVHTGEFRGAQPTGNPVAWNGIGIMRMDCGRIAETWMEVDQIGRATQLGVLADLPATMILAAAGDSLSGEEPPPFAGYDCGEASGAEPEPVLSAWKQAWESGQPRMLDGLLIEDFGGATLDGSGQPFREAQASRITVLHGAMPDLSYDLQFVFTDGDLLVTRWSVTGTMTGEFNGAPPTGRPVSYTGTTMFRLECGRIADVWNAADHGGMLEQMGVNWQTTD